MPEPLRIGIVGCGRILNAHLNGYKALLERGLGDFEVTALCARTRSDADRFVAPGRTPPREPVSSDAGDPLNAPHVYLSDLFPRRPMRVWTEYEAMIDEADIDIVDITASVFAHHPIAVYAASRGKHVMVQKPMAKSIAAAKSMIAACAGAGTVLAVMEDMHYQPRVRMAQWLVEHGFLGSVQMVAAMFLASWWNPDRIVANTAWRHRADQAGGGGISLDLGVHFFQQLRSICGPIAHVYGSVQTFEEQRHRYAADGHVVETVAANVDDAMFCQVEFVNGAIGQLSASWSGHGPATELPGGLVLYGSKGCLRGEDLYLDGARPTELSNFFDEWVSANDRTRMFPQGLMDPFALAYYDFFCAIQERRKPSYDGYEGLIDLAWSMAVGASSRERVPLTAQNMIERAVEAGKGGAQ